MKKIFVFSLLLYICFSNLSSVPFHRDEETGATEPAQKKNNLIALPILYYSPETRLAYGAGGVYYFWPSQSGKSTRPSAIWLAVTFTQNRQFIFDVKPDFYLNNENYHLLVELTLKKYPQKFFGIGNNTPDSQKENYTSRSSYLDLNLSKKVRSQLYVGFKFQYEKTRILEVDQEGLLGQGQILGSRGGTISGLGLIVHKDSRDNIFFPTRGGHYELSTSFYGGLFGSDYRFSRFLLDWRKYLSFFPNHVLALQAYMKFKFGDPPFNWLALLGGESIMRGYYYGRFRDKKLIAFQAEYRLPVWWRFGVVGFAGLGDVADSLGHFRPADFKYSVGWGIRFKIDPKEGTNLRLDFGYGRNTSGMYITVNEAF